jgi:hypothetical protein
VRLSKVSIPVGAIIDSAKFYINVTSAQSEKVNLHRITSDWQESNATWNNFGGNYNSNIEGNFTPTNSDWYSVDITSLVNSWADSTYPNYGLLVRETSPAQIQIYTSKESGISPYFKVWWTLMKRNGFDSTDVISDTYIQSDQGDTNFGNSNELTTGWQDNVETQTLVRFEIERTPIGGCTRSSGYWKTHSAYGPAPYDSTWALIGEDSTFFLSSKSYYQVSWTPPKLGNAYYMLSRVYIAAELNFLKGADPSDAQDAFDEATTLFNTYTPEEIGNLKGGNSLRQEFISLKNILAQYNNGYIGPGSCSSKYDARYLKID